MLAYNRQVTGDPWLFPHAAYTEAWKATECLHFQWCHGDDWVSAIAVGGALRLAYTLYLTLGPFLALLIVLAAPRLFVDRRMAVPLACGLSVVVAQALTWRWWHHYSAPATGVLLLLLALQAARHLRAAARRRPAAVRVFVLSAVGAQVAWVAVQLPAHRPDAGDWSRQRQRTEAELRQRPGRDLVFVGPGTTYDAAGNLTSWNGATFQYDPLDRLSHHQNGNEEHHYLCAPDDERIATYDVTRGSWRWVLRDLDTKPLRELRNDQGAWQLERDYVYRDRTLLAAEGPVGPRYFHPDHLGSPRLITDGAGARTAYHVYYPYGEELTAISQDEERLKFTAHERDFNSPGGAGDDIDYMHARFYNMLPGRFLSPDPAPESVEPTRPQTWNRYTYVANNPLNFVDPNGLHLAPPPGFVEVLERNARGRAAIRGRIESIPMYGPAMALLTDALLSGLAPATAEEVNAALIGMVVPIRPSSRVTSVVRSADEVLEQAVARGPELIAGFRVFGNKGLVGNVFQRNIVLLEAEKRGSAPIGGLLRAFEAEAREAGASVIQIVGLGVRELRFFNVRLAERFGFTVVKLNDGSIVLFKRLDPV